jgi:hypothetical protein
LTKILINNFTNYDFILDSNKINNKFEIVVGNPPYVEYGKYDGKEKLINKYGNISIKYNLDNDPFLGRIRNAVINYEYTRLDGMEVIKIPIECVQVALTSQVIAVSPTTGFKQRIVIKDKFYKLKAYTRFDNSTEWVEIDTTRRLRVLNKN